MDKYGRLASLDLNLLLVFDALAAERSVTAAARRLGLSQPAMSNALARLRLRFDDPLFVRTGRGMQPTPFASVLAPQIQRACDLVAEALDLDAHFEPATAQRTFRIYMADIGEAVFVPRLLREMARRAPRASLQVLRVPEQGGQAAMAAGDVDLALGVFPDLKAGFFQQRLYSDECVCVLRADHPAAAGALTLEKFSRLRHGVVSSVGTGHEQAIARAMARHRLRVALRIPHFMAVPAIVSQTDEVVIVPRRLALAFEGQARIRTMKVPFRIPPLEIRQHWHERYHLDPASRWLRSLVAELFLDAEG